MKNLLITCAVGLVGCAAEPLTPDGWPQRPADRQLRCPDGTDLADEFSEDGFRTVTCHRPKDPLPVGFLLQWNPEQVLVRELQLDDRGYPVKQWRWYDDGGQRSLEDFDEGILSLRKVFYPTGALQEELERRGKGVWLRRLQPDGSVQEEGLLVDDKREGPWKLFREGAEEVVTFSNGLEEGVSQRTYLDGSRESGMWRAGKKHGEWVRQTSAGVPVARVTWMDGVKTGASELYHPNGQPSAQGAWLDDKREGNWVFWHANGQKESEGLYLDGKKQGPWSYWYTDGQLRETGQYADGNKVGEWKSYSVSGVLERVENF